MKRILVIDDDPPIARLVGAALKAAGVEHSLDYCSDGAQGVIKATQGGYDLIALDLHMPFMGGVEALKEMGRSEKSAQIPVVVITAQEDPAFHRRARELGAVAVVTKPFSTGDLGNLLRQVLSTELVAPPREALPPASEEPLRSDPGVRRLGD
jgi:CheY-like chemotaxis protein